MRDEGAALVSPHRAMRANCDLPYWTWILTIFRHVGLIDFSDEKCHDIELTCMVAPLY